MSDIQACLALHLIAFRHWLGQKELVPGITVKDLRKCYGEDPAVAAKQEAAVIYYVGHEVMKSEKLVNFRLGCKEFADSDSFVGLIYLFIGLNLGVIVWDNPKFHDGSDDTLFMLDMINYVFIFVFSPI